MRRLCSAPLDPVRWRTASRELEAHRTTWRYPYGELRRGRSCGQAYAFHAGNERTGQPARPLVGWKACARIEASALIGAALAALGARGALGWALRSVTGVGEVTTAVVLAELGDVGRVRSAEPVVADAGLAPGRRESAGKVQDLGITAQGAGLWRRVAVETSWPLVRGAAYGRGISEAWKRRGRR